MPTDPGRHAHARRRVPRHRDPRVDDAQVREARHEPEHEHAIGRRRCAGATTSSSRHAGERRDVGEIGTELAAVADRNRAPAARAGRPRGAGAARPRARGARSARRSRSAADRSRRRPIDRSARRRGRRRRAPPAIASAQRDRPRVDRRIDPLLELDDQRRVAGRRRSRNVAHAAPSASQQLLVDAAEAAVRHQHDQIAGAMLARRSRR